MKSRRITICGGGNAAHVLSALLADRCHVSVYAPFADEAERLQAGCQRNGGIEARARGRSWRGMPRTISAEPAAVFPGSDIVLLALPASAHAAMLTAAAPYLQPETWVVALPARGGFDWEARAILPPGIILAGMQTLPWACRIAPGRYGELVDILGTKAVVALSSYPAANRHDIAATLSDLLDIKLKPIPSFLALTLANTGQLIHPGIMYGLFHDWNGVPLTAAEAPDFYTSISEEIADRLQVMSEEVQAICRALEAKLPGVDLSMVLSLQDWLQTAYESNLADDSSLHKCFVSNRAYAGIQAPLKRVAENALIPNFESRYLLEDVPYGLLVTRGIAALAGVPTPMIDEMIGWAQKVTGREWIGTGQTQSQDMLHSRTPDRFGINTLNQLTDIEDNNRGSLL
ncbi:MAG: hypothetical protein GXP37_14350 [Chloroflexi bacterium]|nr:hypothetical protein [Chloroflexota bacterium]